MCRDDATFRTQGDDMTTTETADRIAEPVNDVGGRFMLDGATYGRGAELGFAGMDFYFCGRGGVLGPVDAQVVADEFGFFEPSGVRANWEAGLAVMDPIRAAQEYLACGHAWGRANLPEDLDAARLASLVRRVTDGTGGEQPALFAAWRDVDWPDDDRAAALHALHLLRELRGGLHVAAVRDAGLEPHAAVIVRAGEGMAAFFGWAPPHPDPEVARPAWEAAEAVTNAGVAAALEVLDDDEQAELVELVRATV